MSPSEVIRDWLKLGDHAENNIPESTVIGALSFAPAGFDFKGWFVYAGIPIRLTQARNRDSVLRQVNKINSLLFADEEQQ